MAKKELEAPIFAAAVAVAVVTTVAVAGAAAAGAGAAAGFQLCSQVPLSSSTAAKAPAASSEGSMLVCLSV